MKESEATQLFNEVVSAVQRECREDSELAHIVGARWAHRAAWLLLESLKAKGAFSGESR